MSILTQNSETVLLDHVDQELRQATGKPILEMIRLGQIVPNPFQPRKSFNEEELLELANDIAEHGVLQPVNVRLSPAKWWVEKGRLDGKDAWFVRNENWFKGTGPCASTYEQPDGAPSHIFDSEAKAKATLPRYELVAGERRVRATRLTPRTTIAAIVLDVDDKTMAERALAENAQRKDVTALEEAVAVARYIETFGVTQQEAADRCGMSRSRIANRMRLLKLPGAVLEMLECGALSEAHCVTLAGLRDLGERFVVAYAHRIRQMGYSSKEIERGLLITWDWGQELAKQKIALVCERYDCHFDVKIAAEAYPHAFRDTASMNGYGVQTYCFDFDLFDRLQSEAKAVQETADRERLAEIQRMYADGKKAIPLDGLKWNTDYFDIEPGNGCYSAPEGCSKQCECRAVGVKRDGKQVQICLNPKRIQGLRTAQTRKQNAQKKAEVNARVEVIGGEIDLRARLVQEGGPNGFSQVAAIVALPTIVNAGKDALKQAVKRRGLEPAFDVEAFFSNLSTTEGRLTTLSLLPVEHVIGLAAEVRMHCALSAYASGGYSKPVEAEWFEAKRLGKG